MERSTASNSKKIKANIEILSSNRTGCTLVRAHLHSFESKTDAESGVGIPFLTTAGQGPVPLLSGLRDILGS